MEHQKKDHKKLATIFVDTDAFVASIKADDPNHERAKLLFDKLKKYPVRFLTSNFVFSEAVTVLSQRVSKAVAITFIDTMTAPDSPFTMKRVDAWDEEEAISVFKAQPSKNTSYVDCTNIVFMKWLNLDAIFSFDEVYKKNSLLSVEDFLAAAPQPTEPEEEQAA
jgi:predicted nucleic acid-binding protein